MASGKMVCDCGCGVEEHFARLKTLEITYALDESLRRTRVGKRFMVRGQCYQPFIEELQAMRLLQDYVYRYRAASWWKRLWRIRRIIRLQYVINIRLKGIERTKRLSLRSGLMFAAPTRVSGWLDLFFRWRDGRRSAPVAGATARFPVTLNESNGHHPALVE